METIKKVIHPIHKEGYPFIAIFAVTTLIIYSFSDSLGFFALIATLWCVYFFRDPERNVPQRKGLVVSPADGIVSKIEKVVPDDALELGSEKLYRVSIFLNVFNVHVNRIPIAGEVTKIEYHPGKFLNASLDKSNEENERNSLTIGTEDGKKLGVVQIAGLIARRIVCDAEEGSTFETGERFGIIRFGSRTDIYLPAGVTPQVTVGQTMIGGETIIADLTSKQKAATSKRI